MKTRILLLLTILFQFNNLDSQTWEGTISTDWDNANNWIPPVVPGPTDNIFIGAMAPNYPVLTSNKTVNNFAMLEGLIDLNGHDFTANGTTNLRESTIEGTGSTLYMNGSVYVGDINFDGIICYPRFITNSPNVRILKSTFHNIAYILKTGSLTDDSYGNIFNDTTHIINGATSVGWIVMGGNLPDIFNGNLFVKNLSSTSTTYVRLASNTSGNQFNADVEFETSGNNSGIGIGFFASSTSTLATGRQFKISAMGFTTGDLQFVNLTQLGSAAQNLSITGRYIESINSTWNGPVNFSAPRFRISQTTHNNTASWQKTGSGNDLSPGGNTFNDITEIIKSNTSTGRLSMGNTNPDIFNGQLFIKNLGSSEAIVLARNSSGNQFNNDVELQTSGSNTGIWFGFDVSSTSSLGLGKKIKISSLGFNSGDLIFYNFTQLGSDSISLVTNGEHIRSINSTWNGPTYFSGPRVYVTGTVHNNTAFWEKTGPNPDYSPGANVFNDDVILSCVSNVLLGDFYMGVGSFKDVYNGNVTWECFGLGTLNPSFNQEDEYFGNITFAGNQIITAAGGFDGRVILKGGNNQFINKTGTNPNCIINRLRLDKTSNSVTLQTPTEIAEECDFTQGLLNTDPTNLLLFLNSSTAVNANDNSFVNGPVRKIGNQAFTFPTGKEGTFRSINYKKYRPIGISAPSLTTDHFTSEYILGDSHPLYSHDSLSIGVERVSGCEYWVLDRTNGTSNVFVTLSYNDFASTDNCSGVTDQSDLLVARWNGTKWVSHGNGGTTGTPADGTIDTDTPVTSFSPFALGSSNPLTNPLPIELTSMEAYCLKGKRLITWSTSSEVNSSHFVLHRSEDGIEFKKISKIDAVGNSTQNIKYEFLDDDSHPGIIYYKLQQFDIDGGHKIYSTISSQCDFFENISSIYPNPSGNSAFLSVNSSNDQSGRIFLFDGNGKMISRNDIHLEKGKNDIMLSHSDLVPGFYTVRIEMAHETQILKWVVVR